jgi:hypothetical protein
VLKYLEQSIAELDSMDSYVSSYKIHLNVSGCTKVVLHVLKQSYRRLQRTYRSFSHRIAVYKYKHRISERSLANWSNFW